MTTDAESEDINEKKSEYPISPAAHKNLLWSMYLLDKKFKNEGGIENKVWCGSQPGMAYPYDEVESVSKTENNLHSEGMEKFLQNAGFEYILRANIGGLDGSSGPLPPWLSEILFREFHSHRYENKPAPLGDFMDIFSNRFIKLLYLAWLKPQPALGYSSNQSSFIDILFSLMGLREGAAEKKEGFKDEFNPDRLLYYTGVMGLHLRSAAGLRGILRDYFDNNQIEVNQFVPRKVRLDKKYRACLTRKKDAQGEKTNLWHVVLGTSKDVVLGSRVMDVSGTFQVKIGSLTWESFLEFLPGGKNREHLIAIVKRYVSPMLTWEIKLSIIAKNIECLPLNKSPLNESGKGVQEKNRKLRLGLNSWSASKKWLEEKANYYKAQELPSETDGANQYFHKEHSIILNSSYEQPEIKEVHV
ncbi:MAG: type VI secretion system baseplate subunit TssG [Desulfamplus sp.]|nr:type VI secretion system baseplate subunit TssG [Desulfamplus sp.]